MTTIHPASSLATLLFDCFNARDGFDAWSAALADDFTASYPGAREGLDRHAARAYNEGFLPAFSDLHFEFTAGATNGDVTFTTWVVSGTHDGPLVLGPDRVVPPTGVTASFPCAVVVHQRDGKIVREETYWNQLELLGPLGLA